MHLLGEEESPQEEDVAHIERLEEEQEVARVHCVRQLVVGGHRDGHAHVAELQRCVATATWSEWAW